MLVIVTVNISEWLLCGRDGSLSTLSHLICEVDKKLLSALKKETVIRGFEPLVHYHMHGKEEDGIQIQVYKV